MTLQEIIMENDWCNTIETTHVDGRLLLTTTKLHLSAARKWLDESLEALFIKYLPKIHDFSHTLITQFLHAPTESTLH